MPKQEYVIAPSILSADFARLGEEVENVVSAGADWIHFDVMDNHYVSNLTIGPMVCNALREYGIKVPIDVHLMVEPVDELIKNFAESGATYISFHAEASPDVVHSLELIKDKKCKAALALNPDVPLNSIENHYDRLDMVLLMSVFPGFAGQEFMPSVLDKVKQLRDVLDRKNLQVRIEIDGGIKLDNISQTALSGADTFVSGSAIFGEKDYKNVISRMRNSLK